LEAILTAKGPRKKHKECENCDLSRLWKGHLFIIWELRQDTVQPCLAWVGYALVRQLQCFTILHVAVKDPEVPRGLEGYKHIVVSEQIHKYRHRHGVCYQWGLAVYINQVANLMTFYTKDIRINELWVWQIWSKSENKYTKSMLDIFTGRGC
jgi:hypothetical protein